ncbi:hypothetical protein C0J52_08097 [Blattella germanica]|nr:hypothetical protein C0J52_08097 [Blattella germanica]
MSVSSSQRYRYARDSNTRDSYIFFVEELMNRYVKTGEFACSSVLGRTSSSHCIALQNTLNMKITFSWKPARLFRMCIRDRYCPSEYPKYEDHFFVEASSSLQFWCNALNEFILDSKILLPLDTILDKASSLYLKKSNRSPCMSSSDSEPDADLAEEFMVVDGDYEETEDWDHILCQKKKRWRLKEAELRAATKQPKTSDMFDGNVKDHPKQVFSNSGASGILTNDLVAIMESKHKTGINAEPIDDNIYKWAVFLSSVESQGKLDQDLQQLNQLYGYNYVELQLDFTMDLYPFYPPVVKVVRPRLQGSMMLRVASMDMLKLSHWNPARDMRSVLQEIKDYLSTWARLDLKSERNDLERFPQGAYIQMENYLLWLAWVSEIPSRAHRRFPEAGRENASSHVPDTDKKKGPEKSLFPAGTGYSSSFHKGWDINAYMAAQREKDKQIECVLQKILQELRKGKDPDGKFSLSHKKAHGLDETYSSFSIPSCSSAMLTMEVSEKQSKSNIHKVMHESNHVTAAPKKQCVLGFKKMPKDSFSSNCSSDLKLGTSNNWNSDNQPQQNGKSPVDPTEDLFNVLEASTLVPFLESKLQVDSFLEISQHTAVYRCVVDIISEIACRPKLVGLLWTLPDQVQSIYTLVTRLEEKAKAILVQLNKTAANGNIPTTSTTTKKISKNLKVMCSSPGLTDTPEEEKLARDFYEMSHAVAAALGSQGYLASSDNDQFPSTSQQTPRPPSPASGCLDPDQALAQIYKEALKDLQFLSCDIEVEGASAHHYSTHFKKALPPNSAQVIRIAQEMAALSTSLPLDLGSAIFIRTVLISIQSLILVPEPYFNEPGYESLLGTDKGKRHSQSYNEDIIVHTIMHAMVTQLKRPSSGFEDVIRTHFHYKKKRILKEVRGHLKTHNSKSLQRAYDLLRAELDKLPDVPKKAGTAATKKEETASTKNPI